MSEIRVERLTKAFKELRAVDDVTFSFAESEVTCLLGPSGCGKTTLMRMIAGLEKPTSGDIYFGTQRVTRLKPSQRDIGMVFQYPVVYRGISVERNIELPLLSAKLSAEERRRRIQTVVEILGLQDSVNKDITQLDNGTRQKVAVARAVARQPRIILFDEPITNVDANAKLQLKRAFKELTRQLKQTIIYVTHDQTEAMTLADRIALMTDGKNVQCAAPRELFNHPADVFAGWFLGNPGMNFFPATIARDGAASTLVSPLFPAPVSLSGTSDASSVTIGIRPEHVRVSAERTPGAVEATVARKSITIGRQYLLSIQRGDQTFKGKVPAEMGQRLGGAAWVELPLDRIVIFDQDGHRAPVTPVGVAAPVVAAKSASG
ncbi:MAG: multiple sugar transport system ATP-binding protein [Thermomicrobiales bacterium]|nr:multiple sugar transport system ATP-binding protein [Thermomicrobiales bacterium]